MTGNLKACSGRSTPPESHKFHTVVSGLLYMGGSRLLGVATSNGQRNTLPESHCIAKMPLNQSNSQRFTGTLSSYPWEHWQPGPHNNPDRLFRQRFPARTDFSSYPLVHRNQLLLQHLGQPCKTLWAKTRVARFCTGVASTH